MMDQTQEINQDPLNQKEVFKVPYNQPSLNSPDVLDTTHTCDFCGSTQMIPTGTCFVCRNCGSSLGCS